MENSRNWRTPAELREQLYRLYGLECPPFWGPMRHEGWRTYGAAVDGTARKLFGSPLLPWQRYAADVALEIDPNTAQLYYGEVDLSVCRQQGKTHLVKAQMVQKLIAYTRAQIMYTAQTRNDARDKLLNDFWVDIERSRLGAKFDVLKGLGSEHVMYVPKQSRIVIAALTAAAGHGRTLHQATIDEAFAHSDDTTEQAAGPAMMTIPDSQLWVCSAAGTDVSYYWNAKRLRGREMTERLYQGADEAEEQAPLCYLEWYSDDDIPREDPRAWRQAMPALGLTVNERKIRQLLATMEPDEFDRGMLNRTKVSVPPPDPNIPTVEWGEIEDTTSQLGPALAVGVAVPQDRSRGSIVLYGPSVGDPTLGHAELVEYRQGTAWIVARLLVLIGRYHPVTIVIDSLSATKSITDDLVAAGVPLTEPGVEPRAGEIMITNTPEIADATGQLVDAIRQHKFRHIGQAELTAAVNHSRTRPLAGRFALARKGNTGDISPIEALNLARYGWQRRGMLTAQSAATANVW